MGRIPGSYSQSLDVLIAADLDALYAELPTIACKGQCWDSCGPISMSRIEWLRITTRLGYTPRQQIDPERPETLTCPMLKDHRCSVYELRPMICRLWGIVESMPCPWGCRPQPRYLTHREGHDFLLRAELAHRPSRQERAQIEAVRRLMRERPELVEQANEICGVVPPTKRPLDQLAG